MTAANLYIAKSDGYWWSGGIKGGAWSSGGGGWQGVPRPSTPDLINGRPEAVDLGVAVTKYEDLYQTGDTLNEAMARLTTPAVITFPEGLFQQADFDANLGYACINVPKNCLGIWGSKPYGPTSGRDYASTDGTIFEITPQSSTKASYVQNLPAGGNNLTRVMARWDGESSGTWGNFHMRGTDQPGYGTVDCHNYQGFTDYAPNGHTTVQDCLFSGCQSSGQAPPYEEFVFCLHAASAHSTDPFMVARCGFDGRRYSDNQPHGGLGTCQNYDAGVWIDCVGQYARTSSMVTYQCTNIDWFDCSSIHNGTGGKTSASLDLGGHPFNLERTNNIRFIRPNMIADYGVNGNAGIHMTFSNDGWNSYANGSEGDGVLYVENPTWNSMSGLGPDFYIQTWHPYGNGDTQVTAPTVLDAQGNPLGDFKWVHSTDQQN